MEEGRPQFVWYPAENKDEWQLCKLLSRTQLGGASLRVGNKDILVSPEEAGAICPRGGEPPQNHALLDKDGLNAGMVEDSIRNQFCNHNPYSNINDITLCVNPFRYLPIFDQGFIDKYASLDPRLPPHIFNASAKAYKRCTQKKESQVLLLLGERCSGKSVAFEHLLGFLGTTAGDGDEEFRQLLRALRPLISVTRSCGRQSWLSTRAMLEADLGLDGDGFICRTLLTVRCLETQRITMGPKNFDALYLAAKDDRAHEWLGDNLEFRLLGDEIDFEEYDEQGTAGTSWMTSLNFFGIDHGELVRILCGLVLLGQLQFGGEPLQCQPPGALDAVANALGVGAGKLLAALLGGTAEEASQRRDAALQELYHRLVHLVLRQLNAKVAGEAQATPQSMKILEVPSALDAKGFHGMALQRLTEARFAHMLAICRPEDSDGLQDESEQQAAAQGAALQAWRLLRQPKESQEPVTIRGACGEAQYVVDKGFVTAAEGGGNGAGPMLEALSESSCKYLREITNSLAVKPASGTDAAEEALKALSSCLEPKAKAKTWPVCCLRPNDLGAADRVSRPVLLQQVRHLRLAEAAQLAEKGVNQIWSLQSFRARYAKLAPTLEESVEDEAACRLLVKAAGGDKGHVAESVFGGKILQQLMEHKLQESEAGHQHLEGTKSEMRLLMEQKLEADKLLRQQQQTQQEMEREAQRQAQQKELEAVRGQHEEHKLQQSQLLQQLQEQQKALQQQQQEQMESLRRQQERELERLRQQQEVASAMAAKHEPQQPPRTRPKKLLRKPTDGTLKFQAGEARSHPALHAAMSQMAALLRVAKEREQCMAEFEKFHEETFEDLEAERDGWKREVLMLSQQVNDLRRGLQEPNRLSAALAPPAQVIERPDGAYPRQ